MIADFCADDVSGFPEFDACVIGAGAAGITIAREFVGTRYKVIVLESGGLLPESETQALCSGEVTGLEHNGLTQGRARVFGGTTTLWGGQALRFDALDFTQREWVPNSGWPITRRQLDPYYDRAENVLDVGKRFTYQELRWGTSGVQQPSLDASKFHLTLSQWSRCPDFSRAYGDQLRQAQNVIVLLHANATALLTNQTGNLISKVQIKSLSGHTGYINARYYIICCGAIETARLLLCSKRSNGNAIGDEHGLVGRYFQDHLHAKFALRVTNRANVHNDFESFIVRRRKYVPKILSTDEHQSQAQVLRALGELVFEDPEDSTVAKVKRLVFGLRGSPQFDRGTAIRLAIESVARPDELMRYAWRVAIQGRGARPRKSPVHLLTQVENAPYADSRVTLGSKQDRLGMPMVRLHWSVGELERRTLQDFIVLLGRELERLETGTLDQLALSSVNDPNLWTRLIRDGAHQTGTTRMHESPRYGVVDRDCRVHEMGNLYVGSAAVFPTSGHSNPTLTIIALSIRIADSLKDQLGRRSVAIQSSGSNTV